NHNPPPQPAPLPHDEGIRHLADRIDPDRFLLQILADRRQAAFPSDARALVAAEWGKVAGRPIGIDPHRTGFQTPRHGEGGIDTLGPHPGREAILGVVGDRNGFLFVVEGNNGWDGPEDPLNTILADLPPSSSVTRLIERAAIS